MIAAMAFRFLSLRSGPFAPLPLASVHRTKTGALAVIGFTSSLPGRRQASLSKTKKTVLQASASLLWVSSVRGCFSFDL